MKSCPWKSGEGRLGTTRQTNARTCGHSKPSNSRVARTKLQRHSLCRQMGDDSTAQPPIACRLTREEITFVRLLGACERQAFGESHALGAGAGVGASVEGVPTGNNGRAPTANVGNSVDEPRSVSPTALSSSAVVLQPAQLPKFTEVWWGWGQGRGSGVGASAVVYMPARVSGLP
jgi:hypothetical protein